MNVTVVCEGISCAATLQQQQLNNEHLSFFGEIWFYSPKQSHLPWFSVFLNLLFSLVESTSRYIIDPSFFLNKPSWSFVALVVVRRDDRPNQRRTGRDSARSVFVYKHYITREDHLHLRLMKCVLFTFADSDLFAPGQDHFNGRSCVSTVNAN